MTLVTGYRAEEAVQGFRSLYRVDRTWPHLNEWLVRAYTLRKRQKQGQQQTQQREYSDPSCPSADPCGLSSASSSLAEADLLAREVDHYAVLGVPTDATDKHLKTAYRMRSLKFHPDKKGGHTAAFQRIALAYETLSDADKRRDYDEGDDIKVGDNRLTIL